MIAKHWDVFSGLTKLTIYPCIAVLLQMVAVIAFQLQV